MTKKEQRFETVEKGKAYQLPTDIILDKETGVQYLCVLNGGITPLIDG